MCVCVCVWCHVLLLCCYCEAIVLLMCCKQGTLYSELSRLWTKDLGYSAQLGSTGTKSCDKFSKVSDLVYVRYESPHRRTFENSCPQVRGGAGVRVVDILGPSHCLHHGPLFRLGLPGPHALSVYKKKNPFLRLGLPTTPFVCACARTHARERERERERERTVQRV